MKKILFNTVAAIFLTFVCLPTFSQEKPWVNTTIVGAIQGYNPKLTDDFYAAINRDWILSAKIPQGYPMTGTFAERQIQVSQEILGLMTNKDLKDPEAKTIQNLYDLYLDWDLRNKNSIKEIKELIASVEKINSVKDLADYLAGEECLYKGTNFCAFDAGSDISDSSKSALNIFSTSLTLKDSAEYKKLTENGKNQKEFSDSISEFALKKLGYTAEKAKRIIEQKYKLESALAQSMMTVEDHHSPDIYKKILNKFTVEQLQEKSPNFPLVQIMELRGMDKATRIYLSEPAWLEKLNSLFTEENLDLFKSYLIDGTVRSLVEYMDKETYDFYNAAKRKRMGITEAQSYEQDASDFVSSFLPVPLSKLYAKYCVDKNAKKRVTKIIKEVIAEYKKMLADEDWLCKETKKKAIQKLSAMGIHVAYPNHWDDYSDLKILSAKEGETLVSAVLKTSVFFIDQENDNVNKNHGNGMWVDNIFQVNAFNAFTENSIKIIAGILGGDFYRPDMKDEELYGSLGAVIGHEISHSFDATGSQFDKKGAMKNWWTKEDWDVFEKRSQKLVDYFDSMNTLGSLHQSGKTVQGEAAADIGGVKVMLALAKKNPDFDYKLFFETYAHLWAGLFRKEVAGIILNDSHPFYNLRVNVTLQQFDEFIETYGIKPGDKMYLAKENRISIW
ncbi:MAG: M13 family metallopeptidase [Treponema sp.]|nr:M13 family metallopeptidase [Treponema sp.]